MTHNFESNFLLSHSGDPANRPKILRKARKNKNKLLKLLVRYSLLAQNAFNFIIEYPYFFLVRDRVNDIF